MLVRYMPHHTLEVGSMADTESSGCPSSVSAAVEGIVHDVGAGVEMVVAARGAGCHS